MASSIAHRFKRIALSFVFASSLCWGLGMFGFAEQQAYASVLKSDVVMGETVETRGLSVAQCPNIEARSAILVGSDGTVFFERDADLESQIASITKVMTAVTALDSAPLDAPVWVSWNAANIGGSSAYLQAEDSLSLHEALKAMLIPSGNDSAQAIAESIGAYLLQQEGADASDAYACEQRFVAAMNAKSQELGMTASLWENTHGLDDGDHAGALHSTARDLAKLCAYAMTKPEFREIVALDYATCTVDRYELPVALELSSTDELLGSYEGACGIKTGFTDLAGACFAGACVRGDLEIYSIVLGSTDEKQRFDDTRALWDWAFEHIVNYRLCQTEQSMTDASGNTIPVLARVACTSWLDKTVAATVANPAQSVNVFDISGNVSQSVEYQKLEGDVFAGQVVGRVTFKQRNIEIASMDLIAAEYVKAPNLFESIQVWWSRFIGGFTGLVGVAENEFYNQTPLLNDHSLANAA